MANTIINGLDEGETTCVSRCPTHVHKSILRILHGKCANRHNYHVQEPLPLPASKLTNGSAEFYDQCFLSNFGICG